MPTYQCKLVNVTARQLRVTVISWYGEQTYWLKPHQLVLVAWYPGDKAIIVFDVATGALVSHQAVNVQGPMTVPVGKTSDSSFETATAESPAEGNLTAV